MIFFRVTKAKDRTVPIKKENMYMDENDISEENINSFDENLEEALSPSQSEKYFDKYKVKHGHEWTHEEIFHLIEAWEQEESLYSLKYKYHPDRSKRLDAISRIVKKLKDKGIEVSDADVQSKIHSLRVYYSSRKNKAENPNRPDIAARIHWPYYEKLNFLRDNVLRRPSSGRRGPRESLKNNFHHLPGDTFHPAKKIRASSQDELSGCPENFDHMEKVKKKNDTCSEKPNKIASEIKLDKGPDDLFCEMLAKDLKQIKNIEVKEKLKYEIQGMVFRAKFPQTSN